MPNARCSLPTPREESAASGAPDYVDLFERAPVGYLLLGASGCIEHVNRAGAAMLGWPESWLARKPFARWVVGEDKPIFHALGARICGDRESASEELRVRNRYGRILTLRLHGARDPARRAGVPGWRIIMVDVSREQESARRLRQLQSQLAHLSRVNTAGELAASLAHELNQPLGSVVLNCDAALRLLNERLNGDYDIAVALGQAREAACFASDIVRHLRGFLRKSGDMRTISELPTVIQNVSKLIEADARDSDTELLLDIEPDLPQVQLVVTQIEQVLLNLAHNSIEAMREQFGARRVTISARRDSPHRLRVSVEDNGPGLGAEELKRVFTPFYTTKPSGMGIGLSISRTIVEDHGGRLTAASQPGRGAVFQFTLPTAGAARAD